MLLHSSLLWGPTGDLGFAAQFALLLAGAAIAAPDSALGAAAAADACAEEKETQNETFAAAASCPCSSKTLHLSQHITNPKP